MQLGRAIKRLREKNGLTQKELADKADVAQSYLSQIEGDKKVASLNVLERISDQLHTPLPVMFFLALEANDLSGPKKELAEEIGPEMRHLVDRYFPAHHKNPGA